VYYLKLSNIAAEGGGVLWSNEAWYTMLKTGPADVPTAIRQVQDFSATLAKNLRPGAAALELPFRAPYHVRLLGIDGRSVAEASGGAPGALSLRGVPPGVYFLSGHVGGAILRKALSIR
jgi:hypothetical protein